MGAKGYTTVALPNDLISLVDKIVAKKIMGYSSRPDVIKDAVREKVYIIKSIFSEL